jgi:hypothetical protein
MNKVPFSSIMVCIVVLVLGCDFMTDNGDIIDAQSRADNQKPEPKGDYFIPYTQPLPLEIDENMGGLAAGDGDNELSCGEGYTACSNSSSGAFNCCAANESCNTERGAALCRPKDQTGCVGTDRPKFCPGSSTNACCPANASCDDSFGSAWCEFIGTCPAGTTPCGDDPTDCCPPGVSCAYLGKIPFGQEFGACDYKEDDCPEGETHCAGDRFSICCAAGSVCSPGTGDDGSPNCIPIGRTNCEDGECLPIDNDGGVYTGIDAGVLEREE